MPGRYKGKKGILRRQCPAQGNGSFFFFCIINLVEQSIVVLLTVTVIDVPTAFGFSSKVVMMTCALVVKTSVTFNYSSPAQDRSQSENQLKAYQVQIKHYALIFYVLRLSSLEQYFNVWHTVLKYLEPFFFLIY